MLVSKKRFEKLESKVLKMEEGFKKLYLIVEYSNIEIENILRKSESEFTDAQIQFLKNFYMGFSKELKESILGEVDEIIGEKRNIIEQEIKNFATSEMQSLMQNFKIIINEDVFTELKSHINQEIAKNDYNAKNEILKKISELLAKAQKNENK